MKKEMEHNNFRNIIHATDIKSSLTKLITSLQFYEALKVNENKTYEIQQRLDECRLAIKELLSTIKYLESDSDHWEV